MGVIGWAFLLVPAFPGSHGPKAVKRLCVLFHHNGSKTYSSIHTHTVIHANTSTKKTQKDKNSKTEVQIYVGPRLPGWRPRHSLTSLSSCSSCLPPELCCLADTIFNISDGTIWPQENMVDTIFHKISRYNTIRYATSDYAAAVSTNRGSYYQIH